MEENKNLAPLHHKPIATVVSKPLSKSLPHQLAPVVKQAKTDNDGLRATSAASNTVVCYEDISIDYSQYYKEAPITFEDLLSDESSISNVSEAEGYADEPGAVHSTRSSCEDRNSLR